MRSRQAHADAVPAVQSVIMTTRSEETHTAIR